jgi:hypothetical protein
MPRKTLKQRQERNPTDDNDNRVRSVIDNVIGTEDPNDLMLEIMSVLQESGRVPQAGKYYTFVYNPKTPNISYDQNPLVAVTEVYKWGFKAINFHWGQLRQYTYDEVAGQLYEVYPDELADLREVPFANIRLNS